MPKKLILCPLLFLIWAYGAGLKAQGEARDHLLPVDTQSPRACLRSFMDAMDAYKAAQMQKTRAAKQRSAEKLQRALHTLNLEEISTLIREQKGKETALYLKEIIDRIVVPDYTKIPGQDFDSDRRGRWRLAGTEITIQRVTQGENAGEYLFSSNTVKRSYELYKKVKHLPYLPESGQGSGYQEPWLEKSLPGWTKKAFLLLDWWQWAGLFTAILIGLVLRIILRFGLQLCLRILLRSRISKFGVLHLIRKILNPLTYLAATGIWFLALFILQLQGTPLAVITTLLKLFFSLCLIWMAYRAADYFSEYFRRIAFRTESKLDDQLAPLFSRALKVLTVIAGILIAIQNLGINVASLLTGLGLGGLAFALAARDTIANLFGSLMIIFDRPFQIGDWIKLGEAEGNVEDIGFRSTRIRTFYNSVISIPNSEVASSQIDNMGVRSYRRVLANLSITYDTPPQKMEAFLEGIKNIIKANTFTRKDYYHVVFKEYGDSGLVIMVYFYLKVPNWSTELVERQNVYLEIYRLAKDLGVDFAFPTQSLHIESFPEKTPLRPPQAHADAAKEKGLRQIAKEYDKDGKRSKPSGWGIFTAPFREK